jgi:hypothetical protein
MNIAKYVAPLACIVAVSVSSSAFAKQSRTVEWKVGAETLQIHATGKTGPFSTKIKLFVNGEVVAEGATSQFRPLVNLVGDYKGRKIEAECQSVATGPMLHRECTVFVDSKEAAKLKF